jgi:hypothetical protein
VATSVQQLAAKLQAAEQAGNADAREWVLDLKQIALDIKDEQLQVNTLLSAIHSYATAAAAQPPPPVAYAQPQPVYQPGGGMLSGLLGGGFGRAMEMGAGVGLGQSLISSIFR